MKILMLMTVPLIEEEEAEVHIILNKLKSPCMACARAQESDVARY